MTASSPSARNAPLSCGNALIRPDGSSLVIDNLPATDEGGYAGLEDKVDYHTWQLLKGIALATSAGRRHGTFHRQ